MGPISPSQRSVASSRLERGSTGSESSSEDNCHEAISILQRMGFASFLLSRELQSQCGWLVLNAVSSSLVVASVLGTVLLSLPALTKHETLATVFTDIEVVASTFFFFEYFLRVFVNRKRFFSYITSFLGVIDMLVCVAAVPTLYQHFIAQKNYSFQRSHTFHVLSCFRMLRVLKLLQFVREYQALTMALRQELRMIVVFLFAVFTVVLILGTCLYAAEKYGNPDSPFDSIPAGMWWAAVTITTVGYGDLVPQTWLGKLFASMSMLLGYGLLAVPTIVGTLEINQLSKVRDRESTVHSQYFKPPEAPDLQEPLLGDEDMVQFRARAMDYNAKGLKLSAGYSLLEEVVSLWMEKRFQKRISSCGQAFEHRFRLLQPVPVPLGRQLLAKVEQEDVDDALGMERIFSISIFVADGETCKVAEGEIRYHMQSSKLDDLF